MPSSLLVILKVDLGFNVFVVKFLPLTPNTGLATLLIALDITDEDGTAVYLVY